MIPKARQMRLKSNIMCFHTQLSSFSTKGPLHPNTFFRWLPDDLRGGENEFDGNLPLGLVWVSTTESVAILSPLSSLTVYISILHYFCAKKRVDKWEKSFLKEKVKHQHTKYLLVSSLSSSSSLLFSFFSIKWKREDPLHHHHHHHHFKYHENITRI